MKFYWPFIFLILFASCSKKEEVIEPNNIAPPDTTIENVVYEDYVNRCYILICGREPDSVELKSSLNILKTSKLNVNSRYQFLNTVFSKPEYLPHVYDKWRVELLNNLDTSEVTNYINIFNYYLNDSTYQYAWSVLQYERDRLQSLQTAATQFKNKQINVRELQVYMINNYFYDQINMGSTNFVLTSFQHFIGRNPTNDESNNGVSMVNGFTGLLFLKPGSTKNDYLDIFFSSNDYYEGTIIRFYNDYLFHKPTSLQMTVASQKCKSSNDFDKAQKDIMVTNEFVGIK